MTRARRQHCTFHCAQSNSTIRERACAWGKGFIFNDRVGGTLEVSTAATETANSNSNNNSNRTRLADP